MQRIQEIKVQHVDREIYRLRDNVSICIIEKTGMPLSKIYTSQVGEVHTYFQLTFLEKI